MNMNKPDKAFISYSHRDKGWVRSLVENLVNEGVDVWLDEKEISVGESIADKIEEGLRSSDSLVLVISPENIQSSNLFFELGAALAMGKRVIPVVDENVPVKDLPPPIRLKRFLLRGDPQETAREIADALMAA